MFAALTDTLKEIQTTHIPWSRYEPHPEIWILIASLAAMYFYVTRVIGPRVVPKGEPIITRKQSRWYFWSLAVLWIAGGWPIDDWGEQQLFSVHMVQHLLLMLVFPPMFLLATPRWFAQLIIGRGRAYRTLRFLARPLVAGVLFNLVFALAHWPAVVNLSLLNDPFHFTEHVAFVLFGILLWLCVCGPFEEMRISAPMQIIYLLSMSILPTVPGAWLVFADGVVYQAYNHSWRVFGLSPQDDQQLAGFIMKVMGGLYLWIVIFVIFFRWQHVDALAEEERKKLENDAFWEGVEAAVAFGLTKDGSVLDHQVLTYDEVVEEFDAHPAQREHPLAE